MKNKKGSSVIWGLVIILSSILIAVFLGITVFSFNLVNDVISQDVEIGQVNLKNISDTTFGQINTGIVNNADTFGIILLLGMCLLMIINGYYIGSKNPKMFFIIDIFLLALFFIPSIYISQIYETFINSSTVFSSTFIDIIPKTSKFMLNLPKIIASVGVITMIVSYAGIRKDDAVGEGVNVLGF
jgi:hypothetical protein